MPDKTLQQTHINARIKEIQIFKTNEIMFNKTIIQDRLNKDNFWNLMFWVLASLCFAVIFVLPFALRIPAFLATIILIPIYIKTKHGMSFDKRKHFLNKNGVSLKKRYPKNIYGMFFLSFASLPLTGLAIDNFGWNIELLDGVFLSVPILVLVLYFIIINCPISILFYKSAWSKSILGEYPKSNTSNSSFSSSTNSYTTDPSYKSLSSNIFNSNKR